MPSKGKHYRTHPLDLELLRRLHPEGASLGFHTLATTVIHVASALNKIAPPGAELTSAQISARLRSMQAAGFVTTVPILKSRSGVVGWQYTPAGAEHYLKETGQRLEDVSTPDLRLVSGGNDT